MHYLRNVRNLLFRPTQPSASRKYHNKKVEPFILLLIQTVGLRLPETKDKSGNYST